MHAMVTPIRDRLLRPVHVRKAVQICPKRPKGNLRVRVFRLVCASLWLLGCLCFDLNNFRNVHTHTLTAGDAVRIPFCRRVRTHTHTRTHRYVQRAYCSVAFCRTFSGALCIDLAPARHRTHTNKGPCTVRFRNCSNGCSKMTDRDDFGPLFEHISDTSCSAVAHSFPTPPPHRL